VLRLAENTGRKKSPKIAIWAPSHKLVGLYFRNEGMYPTIGKKDVKQQYFLQTYSPYGELRPNSG